MTPANSTSHLDDYRSWWHRRTARILEMEAGLTEEDAIPSLRISAEATFLRAQAGFHSLLARRLPHLPSDPLPARQPRPH